MINKNTYCDVYIYNLYPRLAEYLKIVPTELSVHGDKGIYCPLMYNFVLASNSALYLVSTIDWYSFIQSVGPVSNFVRSVQSVDSIAAKPLFNIGCTKKSKTLKLIKSPQDSLLTQTCNCCFWIKESSKNGIHYHLWHCAIEQHSTCILAAPAHKEGNFWCYLLYLYGTECL